MPEYFHPLIQEWFKERYDSPTSAQEAAWKRASGGNHFLLSAPTGSGKTLSAFLYAIDELLREGVEGKVSESVRVLYISPLKALNSDIRRNLETPLAEIREHAEKRGILLPPVRVGLRSGDTGSSERQSQFRHPPSIFITTPESLNLILTSGRGREFFRDLKTVIIDELHSLMPGKRGVHLISAVERLTLYAGEFQRIGLSATVRPKETACAWLGGYDGTGRAREVEWLEPVIQKRKEIRVSYPFAGEVNPEKPLEKLISIILDRIGQNRSTLVFVPTRSMAESLTRMINEQTEDLTAYAHHGSLSREIRSSVEEKMKRGELRAIIATSSLELGIDIGTLDEVILAGTPVSQASLIQRIGRSGHSVGGVSRGLLLPLSPTDLIFAASAARSVKVNEVEQMVPPSQPLDILCQIILSMGCTAPWNPDELFRFIRRCWVYRNLSRRQFDLVTGLLEGRYAGTRIPELTPRILLDRETNELRSRDSAASLLYMSGGTIADRGNYRMVLADGGIKIGDLDEKFVWENRVGSVFPMTGRMWKITSVGDRDVKVIPTGERPSATPFWRAEGIYGPPLPAQRTGELLQKLEDLNRTEAMNYLKEECFLDDEAAETLMDQLRDYREKTGEAWPHRLRIIQEIHRSPSGGSEDWVMIIHSFRGGKINFLLALCLASLWETEYRQ